MENKNDNDILYLLGISELLVFVIFLYIRISIYLQYICYTKRMAFLRYVSSERNCEWK